MKPSISLWTTLFLITTLGASLPSCKPDSNTSTPAPSTQTPTGSTSPSQITLTKDARHHLNISFSPAQLLPLENLAILPARVESDPATIQHFNAPVTGRIHWIAKPLQKITKGETIGKITSPEWQNIQATCIQTRLEVEALKAQRKTRQAEYQAAEDQLNILNKRIEDMATAGLNQADLKMQRDISMRQPIIIKAQLEEVEQQIAITQNTADQALRKAATLYGIDLSQNTDDAQWLQSPCLPLIALQDGQLDNVMVGEGSWVQTDQPLATLHNPKRVIVRTRVLPNQIDPNMRELTARLVSDDGQTRLNGQLLIDAHGSNNGLLSFAMRCELPDTSTIRPGQLFQIQVILKPSEKVLAIPQSALVRDAGELIFFKRDLENPNVVHRVVADTGVSNAGWIQIQSGLRLGHEVISKGAYGALLAAGTGKAQAPPGFHYHGGQLHADSAHQGGE